jgi:hypothetical protein
MLQIPITREAYLTQEILRDFWKFCCSTNFINGFDSSISSHWQVLQELRKFWAFLWSRNEVKNFRLNLIQHLRPFGRYEQSRGIVSSSPV